MVDNCHYTMGRAFPVIDGLAFLRLCECTGDFEDGVASIQFIIDSWLAVPDLCPIFSCFDKAQQFD